MSGSWQRLLADLKRRQVFKVAAVYGAAGFAIVQTADVFVPALRLSPAITTAIALIVILGFPFALVIAWAFEVTPQGVKRTGDAQPGELEAIAADTASRRWPIGLAALLGVALIALSAWWLLSGRIGEGRSYESIAVLPLVNLSGNPDFDYFGDGLAEELLSALSGVDSLRVAARTSSFAFKGRDVDVRTIADSLGVQTVLEGSVRRSTDRVRIGLQLIDAEDGFHIWSAEYDRPLDDLLALQDDISDAVVAALLPRLRGSVAAHQLGGTTDVEAYDAYLVGRQQWHSRDVSALPQAIENFRFAVARDSSFALGWSGLADAIDALAFRDTAALGLVPEGRAAALRALVLEPDLAEAWASLGVLVAEFDQDRFVGEQALRRAIELKPSYAHGLQQLGGVLRNMGRIEESLPYVREAVKLDPLSSLLREGYGLGLLIHGDTAAAREQFERLPSELMWRARQLGLSVSEAEEATERYAGFVGYPDSAAWRLVGRAIVDPTARPRALDFLYRQPPLSSFQLSRFQLALGDYEPVMEYLQAMHAVGAGPLWRIGTLPEYDPLRSDPRFIAIVRDLGVPNGYDPVTQTAIWP